MRRTILLTLIAAALLLLAVFGSQALTSAPTGEMGTGGQPIAVAPDIPVQARAVGGSPVEFSVALSQSHLLRGGDGRVNLVVTASAPQVQRKARFPLHIALV
ncbi:MAG: hypothetical protein FJ125_08890, partial [Deltaproteobacteria bacterium]|nr:hypothetical protein [Deltaproteobacteria bacterium]